MIHYIAVCTPAGGFLLNDGQVTGRVDYAGQWDSFDEADQFAKDVGIDKYLVFVPAKSS
jgi:hypothetical protein